MPVAADAPRLLSATTVEYPTPVTTWGKYREENTVMVKFTEFELAVPVATRTVAVPGCAMSGARMAAVRRVLSTKVVVRLDPFHCTTDVEVKLVPLTVRVNAAPPATAELGLMLVTVGV